MSITPNIFVEAIVEDVQRRAVQIIVTNIPYDEARRTLNVPSLAERRFSGGFWTIIQTASGTSCQTSVTSVNKVKAARAWPYPIIYARATHYKNSFVVLEWTISSNYVLSVWCDRVMCNSLLYLEWLFWSRLWLPKSNKPLFVLLLLSLWPVYLEICIQVGIFSNYTFRQRT